MLELKYLMGYPDELLRQVHKLIADNQLANVLLKRYGATHDIRTDKALYQYVTALKNDFIRNGAPISKVVFDGKIHIIRHALGTHTTISRVQGNKLKAKREISVSSLFKHVPIEFLKMIVVHELAHLKEKEHDKAFYKLCTYMEPQYHQYELDLRLYLTHLDLSGKALWSGPMERSPLI
ncbi:YgjP-like metallopeptidase domain-containing protein [Noviherbaspirillum autotrophicum]|nr:YgjP-like metallopeptidase domain-containing protein [Noviherbaspirillum autotrophicum]